VSAGPRGGGEEGGGRGDGPRTPAWTRRRSTDFEGIAPWLNQKRTRSRFQVHCLTPTWAWAVRGANWLAPHSATGRVRPFGEREGAGWMVGTGE